jgi:hypothetical protein
MLAKNIGTYDKKNIFSIIASIVAKNPKTKLYKICHPEANII